MFQHTGHDTALNWKRLLPLPIKFYRHKWRSFNRKGIHMKNKLLLTSSAVVLAACSTGSILDNLPDRAPDYRQSNIGRKIEVPPNLSNASLDSQAGISDMSPAPVASYRDYEQARVQRNARGYIEVLPTLYNVQVIESAGALPYISTAADPSSAWQIVKRYWQNNGVRLATDNPQIGIMETDWLENASSKPSAGIGGFLNNLLGFLSDSDQRDRYRLRFSRNAQGGTDIALIYTQSELVTARDYGLASEPAGFTWQLSDTINPELQLEMTRRIALFISAELEKNAGIAQTQSGAAPATSSIGHTQLMQLADGQPALAIYGNYAQSWRVLGIALDRASFAIENAQYETGTYRVRYSPPTAEVKRSFFARLWGSKDEPAQQQPQYLVRLADQGNVAVAIVQNPDGSSANAAQAQALLETVNAAR